jgi:Lipocalin-like domain
MPDLIGTWRLVAAKSFDAEGRPLPLPYGPQAIGRIVFTADRRMMAALSDGRTCRPAPDAITAAIVATTRSTARL